MIRVTWYAMPIVHGGETLTTDIRAICAKSYRKLYYRALADRFFAKSRFFRDLYSECMRLSSRSPLLLLALLLSGPVVALAQEPPTPATEAIPAPAPDAPLPDVPALMHDVERHQREDELIKKDYLYHEVSRFDELDGHGGVKKVETKEFDNFWLNGVYVRKMTKKDGKELSPDEQKKENERVDKEVAKGRERRDKADSKGKETDSHGNEEITVSRILELGSFSNERRIQLNGRPTIVVDYLGDPKAKTHNTAENAFKDIAGTVWVDERDRRIAQLEGHMVNNFKVGGGLVVNVKKDTNFALHTRKINGEAWLPVSFDAHGQVRYLLFFNLNGNAHADFGGYRKFKTKSTLLPDFTPVEEEPASAAAPK